MIKKAMLLTAIALSSTASFAVEAPKEYDARNNCLYKNELYAVGSIIEVGDKLITCTKVQSSTVAPAVWK